jgi:hypothetical protein
VKKLIYSTGLAAAAMLMLLPVVRSVNVAVGNARMMGAHLQADGDPLPPPIPPGTALPGGTYFEADGDPLPPPIPPADQTSVAAYLLADGDPLPPPIPPGVALAVRA